MIIDVHLWDWALRGPTALAGPLAQIPIDGKWVFVAALSLVLLWLFVLPARLLGQATHKPPWWRNVRFWAIVVCLVQIWIYWRFA